MEDQNYLKPKTRTELAQEFGIDRKTLYNWLTKLDLPETRGLLSPRCLKIIYKEYGYPKPKKY